ncbi:MAG: PAS domain S-box protein, partial [Deltaproteobacteria bacterium]|nr:PAS domain S-box protein [Deltaproteobacteria bacterium]
MVKADSSLATEKYQAVHAAPSKAGSSDRAVRLIAAPAILALLALLSFGGWWFVGIAGPENPGRWMLLTMASTFAAGYLALKWQCRQQLLHIRQLEQAEVRLQAELAEHARASQTAQRAAEENWKTIWKVFKVSPDPMAVLDARPRGIFLAVNQSFTKIFGYARDEVLGKTPVELNLLANPENLADFSRMLEPEGYVPDAEAAFRAKDGRIVWGLLSAVTVEVAGNSYVSWIVRDITDR